MKLIFSLLMLTFSINALAQQPVPSGVIHWSQLPIIKEDQREIRKIAQGTTFEFELFEIHATTQEQGAVPKPAHEQKDIEELIIIKEGIARCTIGSKTGLFNKGSVLLIPPLESQSIENAGDGSLTYYVFKFRSKYGMNMERSKNAGGALMLNYDSLVYTETSTKAARKYFDRPTAMCDNFEMHITYLKEKGPSHKPHKHIDTEIILVINGDTEMTIDGKTYTAGPGDLYIIESGMMHGISNATEKPCSYFAFKWR